MSRRALFAGAVAACLLVVLLLGGCGGGPGPATSPSADVSPAAVDGSTGLAPVKADKAGNARVLVGLNHPAGARDRRLVEGLGGKVKTVYNLIPALAATVPQQALDALRRNPNVAYVEGDATAHVLEDQLVWGADKVEADLVWGGVQGATSIASGRVTGAGVKVAIIDTGIDSTHPDLAGNYAGGTNCITGGSPADDNGHGTHCAGIVAAMDNGSGVIETAPKASLYAVKALNSSGSGSYSDIIEGVQWCANNGINVASMSFGGSSNSASLQSACNAAYAKNVLLVAAAGNSGSGTDTVSYPAKYDSVIAVSATDSSNNRASFSSTGPSVELAAPGVAIRSTIPGGSYQSWSGTSMACPHVSGVAALVIQSGITSAPAVRQQLQATATDLGASGRDTSFGFGLINADRAVQSGPVPLPIDNPPSVSLTAPAEGATVSGSISLTANASDDNGVTKVEFFVDGVSQGTGTNAGGTWSRSWNTTATTDGSHVVKAVATDTAGQTASDTNTVTVNNGPGVGTVAGKVTNAKTRKPISGATVQAGSNGVVVQTATTNKRGQYSLSNLPEGPYTFTADCTGYGQQIKKATVKPGTRTKLNFALPTSP
jgi:subtilisin